MTALPPWMSKLAAVGLLLALLAAVTFQIVLPVVEERRTIQDGLDHNHMMIERLSALGAKRGELAEHIRQLEESVEASGLLLNSANELLAAAELRDYVESAIRTHGGELQSSQSLTSENFEGLMRSGIRVTLTATIEELVPALHNLEGQRPYLFVESLEIRARQRRRRGDESAAATSPVLTVRFDVHGYLVPDNAT